MPTVFTHAVVAAGLASVAPTTMGLPRGRLIVTAILCATLPDLDVAGFALGVRYADLWGHRGLTHSLPFAALVAAALTVPAWKDGRPLRLWLFLFVVTASHGVLDALTNGGLGVALFSPFDPTRLFFAWRPIAVSPIGVDAFFSAWGARVLTSELIWIWLPLGAVLAAVRVKRPSARRPPA